MQIPTFSGVVSVNTGNVPNAMVERGADGSITSGTVNTTLVDDTGGFEAGVQTVTSATTLTSAALLIAADATGGTFALTLPACSASAGLMYFVTNKTAHTVTITSNGSDNILTSAGASATTYALTTAGQHVVLWTDGTQWYLKA